MLSFPRFFVALAVVLLIVACQQPAPEKGPLEGAWKITEVSLTTPDTSWTNSSPQPSLTILTKQHYSYMSVSGTEPRALFSEASQPTDAEKLAAYDSFEAHAGTYEVTDSTITIHPLVAKSPNFMAGESLTLGYKVSGDSVWYTLRFPWAPDTTQTVETRVMLVRLE